MKTQTAQSLGALFSTCLIVTLIAMGFLGFFLFHVRNDVAFRRKWFPRYVIVGNTFFIVFVTALMVVATRSFAALQILLLFVPLTVLISYTTIRFTKFCEKCGATVQSQNWFSPLKYCSKCGAKLDPVSKSDADPLE